MSDLTAELASRVGRDLSDILDKRVDMLEDFMAVADIIVDEASDAHDDLKQEFQNAIGPHLCMLLQQQDFCNLLQDDPKFCFDTLSTAVSEITRVTEESEKKLADAEKQHRVNDSAIDFPTFDTPVSKKPARESASEGPKTPDTSKKIKLESPPSAAEAIGPDSMRTADAGSTPFAGPRFSRGMGMYRPVFLFPKFDPITLRDEVKASRRTQLTCFIIGRCRRVQLRLQRPASIPSQVPCPLHQARTCHQAEPRSEVILGSHAFPHTQWKGFAVR